MLTLRKVAISLSVCIGIGITNPYLPTPNPRAASALGAHGGEALDTPAPDQLEQCQPDHEPQQPQREVADNRVVRDAPQDELDRKVDSQLERQILRDLLYGLRQQLKRHEQPTKQDEQRIIKLVER